VLPLLTAAACYLLRDITAEGMKRHWLYRSWSAMARGIYFTRYRLTERLDRGRAWSAGDARCLTA